MLSFEIVLVRTCVTKAHCHYYLHICLVRNHAHRESALIGKTIWVMRNSLVLVDEPLKLAIIT